MCASDRSAPPPRFLWIIIASVLSSVVTPAVCQEKATGKELWAHGTRKWAVRVDEKGAASVEIGGKLAVSGMWLVVFGPGWKAATQRSAVIDSFTRFDDGWRHIHGRIEESVSGKHWQFEQAWRLVPEGIWFRYRLAPQSEMDVNEVSLVIDLPISVFEGRWALLYPGFATNFPLQPPANRHFARANCCALIFNRHEPKPLAIELSRPHLCNIQDTRVWDGKIYQAFIKIIESKRTVSPYEEWTLDFVLTPRSDRDWPAPSARLKRADPLKVTSVSLSKERVPIYGRLDVSVELQGTWDTPFWQEEVQLDACVRTPSGRELVVPGFFTREFGRRISDEVEMLMPTTQEGWHVRFTPTELGEYSLHVTARDRSGATVQSRALRFSCVESKGARGFVRVSRRDKRYFEFDDGSPYLAIGENLCWYRGAAGTTSYDRWLPKLAANGANYIRIWMPQWAFGLEDSERGRYRLDRAWQLDYVLELCERYGIYVKLCLENFRHWQSGKVPGPPAYHESEGGPCKTVMDFFTHPDAERMFKNRLRYCVARWGYSPNLFAWELWNEINCVEGYREGSNSEIVRDWSVEMARYLKSIDPWRHITTNSLGSCVVVDDLWQQPEMEFAQVHGYYYFSEEMERDAKDMAAFVCKWLDRIGDYGKPILFAEFGLVRSKPEVRELCDRDEEGVNMHNGMWAAVMDGAAGTAMLWWWDSYVEPMNLYPRFRTLSLFTAGVPWTTAGFRKAQVSEAPEGLRVTGLVGKSVILLWLQNKNHTWWNVTHNADIASTSPGSVKLANVADGRYEIEWWDTWAGEVPRTDTVDTKGQTLTLSVPPVKRDIAAKMRRVSGE